MDHLNIEIRYAHRGAQQRSYGPHVWEAEIEITSEYPATEDQVKDLVRTFLVSFTEEPDTSMSSHFRPRIRTLQRLPGEEDIWHVLVEEPFCD